MEKVIPEHPDNAMMNIFMNIIGMGDWVESQKNLQLLIAIVRNYGLDFPGYRGVYQLAALDDVDIIINFGNDMKIHSLSPHVQSANFWKLTIADRKPFARGNSDGLCKNLFFQDKEGKYERIPVRIICGDVMPCFTPGEEFDMTVAAFALGVSYYPNKDAWAQQSDAEFVEEMNKHEGNIAPQDDGLSIIKGPIKRVEMRIGRNARNEKMSFYCVTVETCYGDIGIYHALDKVGRFERQHIREGDYVFAFCAIQGNPAIWKYANTGAIYDEEHCIKLLKDCFDNYDFSRSVNAFARDAKFFYGEKNILLASGGKAVIEKIESVINGMRKNGIFMRTRLGKVEKYHGRGIDMDHLTGRPVIVSATSRMMSFTEIYFIEMNAENKISKIFLKNIDDYSVATKETIHHEPNEYVYLNLIKNAIDSGDSSRIINYLDYNVELINLKGEHLKGCYVVAYNILARLGKPEWIEAAMGIDNVDGKTFNPKTYVIGLNGKKGIALSLTGANKYDAVFFIDIKGDKITAIKAVKV